MTYKENSSRRLYRPYGRFGNERAYTLPELVDEAILAPVEWYRQPVGTAPVRTGLVFGPDGSTLREYGTNIPRFSYQSDGRPNGLLLETTNSNRLAKTLDFATTGGGTVWGQVNITGAGTLNATGPDGLTSAITLTSTAANGYVVQSRGPMTGFRVFSVWLRRVSGTGNVQIAYNTAGTWSTVSVTSTWQRFHITATSGSAMPGIRLVTSGDSIEAFGPCLHTYSGPAAGMTVPQSTTGGIATESGFTQEQISILLGIDAPGGLLSQLSEFTIQMDFGTAVREFHGTTPQKICSFIVGVDAYGMGNEIYMTNTIRGDGSSGSGESYFEDLNNMFIDGPVGMNFGGPITNTVSVFFGMGNYSARSMIGGEPLLDFTDPAFDYNPTTHGGLVYCQSNRGGVYLRSVSIWPRLLSINEMFLLDNTA